MNHIKLVLSTALVVSLFASGAHARTAPPSEAAAPTVATPAPPSVLSIALPPNAHLRFDLDAQDEDVLGVVKSLLRGFNGAHLKGAERPLKDPASPSSGSASDASGDAALKMLSDADLETMLRDVHHLRVVVFETPRDYGNSRNQSALSRSVLNYYQSAYIGREGGRRVMRADLDDVQMIGVGFPNHGFALVFQGPGIGAVVRADGYPNLESVGPVAMGAVLLFAARTNATPRRY